VSISESTPEDVDLPALENMSDFFPASQVPSLLLLVILAKLGNFPQTFATIPVFYEETSC
jgi:hypothetical protein